MRRGPRPGLVTQTDPGNSSSRSNLEAYLKSDSQALPDSLCENLLLGLALGTCQVIVYLGASKESSWASPDKRWWHSLTGLRLKLWKQHGCLCVAEVGGQEVCVTGAGTQSASTTLPGRSSDT